MVVGHYRAGSGDAGAVALAGDDGATGYLDLTRLTPEQESVLAGWLADPDAPKVLHDAKEQLHSNDPPKPVPGGGATGVVDRPAPAA